MKILLEIYNDIISSGTVPEEREMEMGALALARIQTHEAEKAVFKAFSALKENPWTRTLEDLEKAIKAFDLIYQEEWRSRDHLGIAPRVETPEEKAIFSLFLFFDKKNSNQIFS